MSNSTAKNTNVSELPLVSRLGVQNLASKCGGVCGACLACACFGRVECAEIASAEKE